MPRISLVAHQVVGIAHHGTGADQVALGVIAYPKGCLHPVQRDVQQQWANYASYNVAKKLLEFEFKEEIPRTRLRAGYGQGFLGAPVRCSPSAEGAFPQEQQHDDGTERSQDPQVCRGADHV